MTCNIVLLSYVELYSLLIFLNTFPSAKAMATLYFCLGH